MARSIRGVSDILKECQEVRCGRRRVKNRQVRDENGEGDVEFII